MHNGIITRGVGGFYYVIVDGAIYECKARGLFRKKGLTPLPGDRVDISIVDEEKKTGIIENIQTRESILIRPAIANVNQLVAVVASNSPAPDMGLLEKMLVNAEQKGLSSIICVNKTDLGTEVFERISRVYSAAGYRVIGTSSKEGTGIDKLEEALRGKLSVFAGQSGVGKSTLLNSIFGSLLMETGEVSSRVNRGRHTTRHSQLIALPSGSYVADTPGFSFYELELTECEELYKYYPEFSEFIGECRFNPCNHINEPKCAVKEAVRDGKISEERYAGYVRLFGEIKESSGRKYCN